MNELEQSKYVYEGLLIIALQRHINNLASHVDSWIKL